MDIRTELDLINKHFRNHHRTAGESVVWYEFEPLGEGSQNSKYDDVYDEGSPEVVGRKYKQGIVLPTLLIGESEDAKRAIPEGRQVVQNIDLFISMADMRNAGVTEPWEYQQHLNDMFSYDGRYFTVWSYRVRGRLRDEVFVLIEGMEVYVDQEMVNDLGPNPLAINDYPWPAHFPKIG
jgi:hypothetical protein